MFKIKKSASALVLFFCFFQLATAQDLKNEKESIRKYVANIPESSTKSTDDLALYLTQNYTDDWQKAYAIYYWIANNIAYDVSAMKREEFFSNQQDLIDAALLNKKGVCQHYAELYHDLAKKSGLKSLVITGYTRQQNGEISEISHAWIAVKIDGSWYLSDPTWAHGYLVKRKKLVKEFTDQWFIVKPEKMIEDHMPFDPLFQFLAKPINNKEFYNKKKPVANPASADFDKEIDAFFALSGEQQLLQSVERMEASGIVNQLILDEANNRVDRVNALRHNQTVDANNEAVIEFNNAVARFNDYINSKNTQFTKPHLSDEALIAMFEDIGKNMQKANSLFSQVKVNDKKMKKYIEQNLKKLRDLNTRLNKEKSFLEKYLNTAKPNRMALFNQL
jgi:transglutaminase superfamily protein